MANTSYGWAWVAKDFYVAGQFGSPIAAGLTLAACSGTSVCSKAKAGALQTWHQEV